MFLKKIKFSYNKIRNTNFIKNSNFLFSDKLYKVTFSGLDKFLSNEDFKRILDQLNEVKIHRTNKSANKNYAHADISSYLSVHFLKEKFEGIKIMGKSVKIRVKELDEETTEFLNNNYNNFNFNELTADDIPNSKNLITQFIKSFYIKNLSDNPYHVKNILDQMEKSDDWLLIQDYEREIFEFEYKLQVLKDYNSQKMSRKEFFNNPTFLPIRTFTEFQQDPKYSSQSQLMKEVFDKLEEIFLKLGYPSYDVLTNKGVYRNLQVKYLDSDDKDHKFLFTLMLSMTQLTETDIRIICEALKYEFRILANNVSFYLSVNEKVQGLVHNSSVFYHVFGNFNHLTLKTNQENLIKIYPFNNDTFPSYLKDFDLNSFFNKRSDVLFNNVIELDFSHNFTPISSLMKVNYSDKCIYLKDKYDFGLFDINTRKNLLEENGDCLINLDKINSCIPVEKNEELLKQIESMSNMDNLMIINLRKLSTRKMKFEKILESSKYHIIISQSLLQILDFLKNYTKQAKLCKIMFIREIKYEVKEVVLALELY